MRDPLTAIQPALVGVAQVVDVVGGQIGDPVERKHTNRAHELYSGKNEKWIAKKESIITPVGLAGEALGFVVGRLFHAPVAEGGVAVVDGERWFCSRYMGPFEDAWVEDVAGQVVNLVALVRLVALDLFIGNEDRHNQNVRTRMVDGARHVFGIDHERALLARGGGLSPDFLTSMDRAPLHYAYNDAVRGGLVDVARLVAALPQSSWNDVAAEVSRVAPGVQAVANAGMLRARAAAFPALANLYIQQGWTTP